MGFGIRINDPSFHLRTKRINVLLDFRHGPIELRNMSQGKSSAEIGSGRRIRNILSPNRFLNGPIFPEGFQVIQEIAADKRIGRQGQNIFGFRISPFSLFDVNMFIQGSRNFQGLGDGIEERKARMNG